MEKKINPITRWYKEQYRADLSSECVLYLRENPDAETRELKNLCNRWVYHNRLAHESLDAPIRDSDGEDVTFADLLGDSTDHEAQMEAVEELKRIFSTLSPTEAKVFTMYHIYGYTVEEITNGCYGHTGLKSEKRVYQIINKFKSPEIQC